MNEGVGIINHGPLRSSTTKSENNELYDEPSAYELVGSIRWREIPYDSLAASNVDVNANTISSSDASNCLSSPFASEEDKFDLKILGLSTLTRSNNVKEGLALLLSDNAFVQTDSVTPAENNINPVRKKSSDRKKSRCKTEENPPQKTRSHKSRSSKDNYRTVNSEKKNNDVDFNSKPTENLSSGIDFDKLLNDLNTSASTGTTTVKKT